MDPFALPGPHRLTAALVARLLDATPQQPGPPRWMRHGACRDADPEPFFPERGGVGVQDAVQLCRERCPVRQRCLDYALEHDINDGIWGGLTANQRAAAGAVPDAA